MKCDEIVTCLHPQQTGRIALVKNLFAILALTTATMCLAAESQTPIDIPALEKAAADNDPQAQYELGKALYRGTGIDKDPVRSADLILASATAEYPPAMDGLGYLHLQGEGVEKNEAKAAWWFQKAAEAGYPKGQLNYGLLLRQGSEIERSNEESLLWISKAAEGGLTEAQSVLARIYFHGDRLAKADPVKAYEPALAAAQAGDPVCQSIMGIISRDGVGTAAEHKNPEEVEKWFRKAAEQNDKKAQADLAVWLGVADPESPKRREAIMWLFMALDQNEITAQKIHDEIAPTFPPTLALQARKDASRQLLLQMAKKAAAKKKAAQPEEGASPKSTQGGS